VKKTTAVRKTAATKKATVKRTKPAE